MKSETMASMKYMLAVMGLAVVAAGKVLVEHSDQIDVMDDALPQPDTATVPTTAAPAQITIAEIADAQRDKTGLPWDARIHSGNKTINADGSWKKRKGVSDAIVDAVTAELRATCGMATGTGAASAPTGTIIPVADIAQLTNQAIAPPAPVAVPVPAVIAAPAPVSTPYTQLCDFLAKNTGNGHALNDDWVGQFFAANSTTLPALATDMEKSGTLLSTLRSVLQTNNIAEVV